MPLVSRVRDLPPSVHAIGDGTAAPGPPGVLLHPGGPTFLLDNLDPQRPTLVGARALAPAPPGRALALDAAQLTRLLQRVSGRPGRWSAPSFVREVDLVRSHLRPIRSHASLAASFGREAFHGRAAPGSPQAFAGSAVRVAYALRWLELTDEAIRPVWRELIACRAP